MKRTAMFFVSLMMVVMVSAQGYDFMFNNVTPVATSNVKSVSVNQLAQASARRSGNTRTATLRATTAATAAPQTVQYTETQQQVMNMASANEQKVVMCGTIENVYNNGWELMLDVRTNGVYGGVHRYTLQGYNSNIEICRGDRVYFATTYTGNSYPQIVASEFLNYTGTQRYMTWTANEYYGGNFNMMLMQNGQMSKWQRALMNITSTAMTVATLVQVVKSIF